MSLFMSYQQHKFYGFPSFSKHFLWHVFNEIMPKCKNSDHTLFIPHHTKSGGVPQKSGGVLYSPKILKFWVCPSVLPPVSTSFSDSNLSSFWPISFKLCMDIDIGEEWFGICKCAKFVYKQQEFWPLIDIKLSFPDSDSGSFWPIFFKFCMDIDIRKKWFGIANGLKSYGPWSM